MFTLQILLILEKIYSSVHILDDFRQGIRKCMKIYSSNLSNF